MKKCFKTLFYKNLLTTKIKSDLDDSKFAISQNFYKIWKFKTKTRFKLSKNVFTVQIERV